MQRLSDLFLNAFARPRLLGIGLCFFCSFGHHFVQRRRFSSRSKQIMARCSNLPSPTETATRSVILDSFNPPNLIARSISSGPHSIEYNSTQRRRRDRQRAVSAARHRRCAVTSSGCARRAIFHRRNSPTRCSACVTSRFAVLRIGSPDTPDIPDKRDK
jgi:hypothetical protein